MSAERPLATPVAAVVSLASVVCAFVLVPSSWASAQASSPAIEAGAEVPDAAASDPAAEAATSAVGEGDASEGDAAAADAGDGEPAADAAGDAAAGDASGGAPLDLAFELPLIGRTVFSMTSTTTARFRGNNDNGNPFDDDFFAISQRFDLALQSDELRLELRLDGFLPFAGSTAISYAGSPATRPGWFASQTAGALDSPYPGGSACPEGVGSLCYLGWDVRPERMVLRWEHEGWTLEAGDAQLVLGRGIALSFRKVDLLAVDNALRGGHVRYDDGHLRARLHFGVTNPQNQDPLTLRVFQEPEDLVGAGSVGATFGPNDLMSVNAHAARVWFANDTPAGGPPVCGNPDATSAADCGRAADIAGWTLEMPGLADGRLSLYAEANGMRRTWVNTLTGDQQAFGRAVYASAQLALDQLTLLVEWKDYRNFLVAPTTLEGNPYRIYSAAPSLEFDGPQRLFSIGNQRGGSVRMDYAFLPGPYSFSLNYALFGIGEEPAVDPWDGVLVSHAWATFMRRQEYGEDVVWSLNVTGGYRREMFIHERTYGIGAGAVTLSPGDAERSMTHALVSGAVGSGDHALEFSVDHRFETTREFNGNDRNFQVGGVSLTYSYGIQFVAAVTLRWSDFLQNVVQQRALRYGISEDGAMFFPSLELQWNFDPGTFVRAFVGATPGGQICSGGVCREVPAYEGVVLQFVGRL